MAFAGVVPRLAFNNSNLSTEEIIVSLAPTGATLLALLLFFTFNKYLKKIVDRVHFSYFKC